MLPRGRPKDQAPSGHVTVREAAQILGVSDQAIRQRIKRGTLTTFTATTATRGKELRHYIPREEVEEALKRTRELQLPMEDQRGGVDPLAARLDAMNERQERTERLIVELLANPERQERIGAAQEVSVLRERLETEQAAREAEQMAREAAERERDELRMQLRRLIDPQEVPSQELPAETTEGFEPLQRVGAEAPAFSGIDGEKIKNLRDGRWWTQEALARESGVNRMTLSEIERGINTHPRRDTIFAIARAFGVPPEQLMIPAP